MLITSLNKKFRGIGQVRGRDKKIKGNHYFLWK